MQGDHVQHFGGEAACFMHASKAFGIMSYHCFASHCYLCGGGRSKRALSF
jgi:hypothetical protein